MKLRKDEALDPHVVQELAELEAALGPELRRLRSEPRPEFAAELDARAAAQFGGGSAGDRVAGTWERFRSAPLRRQLMPVAASGLAAIVVATAIVASVGEEQGGGSDGTVVSSAPQAGGGATAAEPAAPAPSVTEQAGRLD